MLSAVVVPALRKLREGRGTHSSNCAGPRRSRYRRDAGASNKKGRALRRVLWLWFGES